MTTYRLDRAEIGLGVGALVLALFLMAVHTRANALELPFLRPALGAVLLAVGVVAVAGGVLGGTVGRALVVVAGLGSGVTAVVHLVLAAQGTANQGGLMSLFGGFAVGLLIVALTPRREPTQ